MSHEGPCIDCGQWAPLDHIEGVCEQCWNRPVFKPTWRDRLRWATPDLWAAFAVLSIAAAVIVAYLERK